MSTYRIDQHEVHVLIKTDTPLDNISVSSLTENIVTENTGSTIFSSTLQENIVTENTGSTIFASSLVINVIMNFLSPKSYTYIID
jgi:hypothetical protein